MSWIEVECEIEESGAKKLSEQLENFGALAVSYYDASGTPLLEPPPGATPFWQRMKLVGLFAEDTNLPKLKQQLKQCFATLDFHAKTLEEKDWTRMWLEHFRPIQFGEKLWVMPSNVAVVKLDPGLAFGTGTHPTTALCLQWLNDNPPSDTVIDYGCGSGILGIAALLLGAKDVLAVDYDPQALVSTKENAVRNHIDINRLNACLPDALPSPLPTASLILANILAEPLISLAPQFARMCKTDGTLVLSGLLSNQIEAVCEAYAPWFVFDEPKHQEDWVLLSAKRCNSLVESV